MRIAPALLFLGIACAPAAAQRREPTYQAPAPTIVTTPFALVVAGFDRDGDMIVTRAEYDSGVAASFAKGDQDANGRISLIELTGWSLATLGNSGALPGQFDFDKDGDDSISRDEFIGLFAARFATLDADKNDALKRSELVSFTATTPLSRRERERFRENTAKPQE
jgi:Ca2+-binding EF-hand superfamily protein